MREVVKIKEVTQEVKYVTYIADDGKEFTDSRSCEMYEFSTWIEREVFNSPNIEASECRLAPGDGCENMEYWSYYWLKPKNSDGVNEINRHIDPLDPLRGIDDNSINNWVCIEVNDCCDVWISEFEDTIYHVNKLLEELNDPRRL